MENNKLNSNHKKAVYDWWNSNNTKKCCKIDVETDFRKRNDFNISHNYYYMNFPGLRTELGSSADFNI